MKTYHKVLNLISAIIIISFFLFSLSCSDDPSSPKEEIPKDEITIGINGGEIEKGNFKIIIPSGAFDKDYNISVSEIDDDGAFGENTISGPFEIAGLPGTFTKSLRIEIQYGCDHTDDIFIAVGNEFYNEVYDSISTIYDMYEALDSSGVIIVDIPVNISNAFQKNTLTNKIFADNSKKFVSIVDFQKTYVTKHFKIIYPITQTQEIVELGNILESVYDVMVNDLEYLEDKYSNLPVVVKNQKKTVDFSEFFSTINISRDDINISNLDNFEKTKISCCKSSKLYLKLIPSAWRDINFFDILI